MMPSVDGPSLTTTPRFSTKMSSIQVGCVTLQLTLSFVVTRLTKSMVDMESIDDLPCQLKLADQMEEDLAWHICSKKGLNGLLTTASI